MAGASIDLNADVAESFGARRSGDAEPLFAFVSSANVACGFHAGDPSIIAATIEAAIKQNVALGAHPSYPDPGGFGRKSMHLSPDELRYGIIYQIGAVQAIARSLGARLNHVKPHGALYNDAARDPEVAQIVAEAIASFDSDLILVGLAGSALLVAGRAARLAVAAEAFCDRRYEDNGLLRNRAHADAVLQGAQAAVAQALEIATEQVVHTASGHVIQLEAQTLCVHGDTPDAAAIAEAVRTALTAAGITIRSLSKEKR